MRLETQDGLELDYHVQGDGHPILCLSGLTRSASDFDNFVNAFGDKAKIITMTYRGREPSDFDPNWKNYNIFQEARDAIALLDFLDVEKALWLGTSRGGLVSLAANSFASKRIAGVVLNDIGPELVEDGLLRIFSYLGVAPEYRNAEEAAQALKLADERQFPALTDEDWVDMANRRFRFKNGKSYLRYDPKLRDAVLEPAAELDLWRAFRALGDKPCGVVWGENSDLISAKIVAKMKDNHPDLEVAKIADRGHTPFLDEPEAITLIASVFRKCFGL